MNDIKKIGLSALAASMVACSANAADIAVTGGAGLTLSGGDDGQTGNGLSMTDGVSLAWGGELDNGWTVDMSFLLDSSDTVAGAGFDNRSLAIGMGDAGTLTFHGDGGSGVVGSFDDKTPSAYEESWFTADSPNQGASTNNMFYYTNSFDAITLHASYTPSDTSVDSSSAEFGAVVSVMDNLTLGGAVGTDQSNATAGADVDNTILYATYTMGAATVGVTMNESDSVTANADEEFAAFGISYAVNEDLSVSYGSSSLDYETTGTETQKAVAISASYTMGSMTLAGTMANVENDAAATVAGSNTNSVENRTYEIGLTFAF